MQLALGTVQFGLRYGVAGRPEPVPEAEVRTMLAYAAQAGIRVLDTAAAYGDIEARLLSLMAPASPFRVVSKLPPLPARPGGLGTWITEQLNRSAQRLDQALYAVMFHRAEDLLEAQADVAWQAAADWANNRGLRLGVSCYDAATLLRIRQRYPVTIAQVPGNALDQRLRQVDLSAGPALELHLRSAFLQGLLLMPRQAGQARVPAAANALARWHDWLRVRELPALQAAMGVVKGLPGVSHCVIGVDDLAQLKAVVSAWALASPLQAPELHEADLDAIDPRRWTTTS